ncbi:DUF4303 domain-containing protein [Amycolatopsis roodepoortensis]|uniref:DUF4303 domain-containing protein n=1 Tax=Amycolatopsis roodepoortensis TaxID=700274 RepID=A0ABR9L643_9PSEU|nr:DUF4303 domain-containing protein [Amycolatopsis roodepoortensis]MBE1576065.1 hypothetical protein [Amycolatopsis roodepoortensis]
MDLELRAWARDWSDRLRSALEQAIAAVAGQLPPDDVAGVGIATDADATSIVAFAHSRRHLDEMIAEDPEFAIDARWHLGEWDMDIRGAEGIDDPLEPVRAEAERVKRRCTDSDLREFRRTVWDSISQALTASVAAGFFEQWPNAVRAFLPLDADVSEADIARWNAALNGQAETAEFREFLQVDIRR